MRKRSMKKFGTPGLAAPGVARVTPGSFCAGAVCASAWSPVGGSASGAFGASSTLPVSDSVLALASSVAWFVVSSTFFLVLVTGSLSFVLVFVLPEPLFWVSGVAVAVGVDVAVCVGVAVTVGACVAVGVGVVSVEPRSTIEDTGAGRPGIWI